MILETKIENSFPKGQFLIKGFCEPFRIDRKIHGGGILFYVREDIPVKLLSVEPLPAECLFVEINLRKRKWLVCCSYNPHKDNISNHLQLIRKKLDLYSSNYERIILVGDFSSEINDKCMNDFCESYNLSSLIRESTCYKNPENPSCIDLFLTNSPNSFQNSGVVETGLSDFHRMIVTVMKTSFQRLPPKIRHYRDYSNYGKKDKIIKTDTKATNVLYTFFSKIISNLNVPKNPVSDPISNDINNPVLKSILKYKDHRSIKAIEKISKLNSLFKFCNVEKGEILYEIVNLNAWKSCQDTDVPTKII